jgi:hypothetical protein
MAEQRRDVGAFDSVELRGVGRLVFEQGPEHGLRIVAEEDVFDKVVSEVRDGKLTIKLKVFDTLAMFKPVGALEYHVTAPTIRSIALHGAGTASASVAADELSATLSGAGKLMLGVRVGRMDVTVSGTGGVEAQGVAETLKVAVSGMGEFRGEALESADAEASISGAGKIGVCASTTLDATISGAGTIEYSGEPQVTERVSGLGKVERRG